MTLVNKTFSQLITFTRASSATFVGSNGLIQTTPQSKNLFTWTEAFDNAAVWTAFSTIVSANASVAPDGTSTADLVAETTAISAHSVYQAVNVVSGLSYTVSVFVKKGAGATAPNIIQLTFGSTGFGTGQYANFDINTGVLGTVAGGTASITSAGGGWYRISFTATATSTASSNNSAILFTNNNDSLGRAPIYTGVTTSDVLIWGAQLEVGSTATSYTKNDGGLFPPRFDYDPVTLAAKGLLIEEQRTNLLTYSEDFTNAAWTKTDTTVTPNDTVSPDGSTNADTATPTGAGPVVRQTHTTSTTGAYTGSVWLRSASNTNVTLSLRPTGAGSPVSVVCAVTPTWQRFTVNITASAGITNLQFWIEQFSQIISIWGAQLEAGSFATSYIPTVASQVTRSADVALVNTLSPWYNATEGTIYVEAATSGDVVSSYSASITNAGGTNVIGTDIDSGGLYRLRVTDNSVNQALISVVSPVLANTIYKIAGAYRANDFAASANGGAAGIDTSGTVPANVTSMAIGSLGSAGAVNWNGWIRRITYYKRRLSNADLQSITL